MKTTTQIPKQIITMNQSYSKILNLQSVMEVEDIKDPARANEFMKDLYDATRADGNERQAHPYLELKNMYEETGASLDTRWCKLIIGDYTTQAIPLPTLHRHRKNPNTPGTTLAGILDISSNDKYVNDSAWAGTGALERMKETPLIEMSSITCNHNLRLLENLIGIRSNKALKEGKIHYYHANTLNSLLSSDGKMEQHRWEEFCLRDAGNSMWEEGYDTTLIIEMMKNSEMYENVVKLVKTRILSHKNFIKGTLGDRTIMGKLIVEKYQESAGELITDFWDRYGMKLQQVQSKECIFNYHLKCSQHSIKRLPEQIFYQELKNSLLEMDCVELITMGKTNPDLPICNKARALYLKISDEYAKGRSNKQMELTPEFKKVGRLFKEFCRKMTALPEVNQKLQFYPRFCIFHVAVEGGVNELNCEGWDMECDREE